MLFELFDRLVAKIPLPRKKNMTQWRKILNTIGICTLVEIARNILLSDAVMLVKRNKKLMYVGTITGVNVLAIAQRASYWSNMATTMLPKLVFGAMITPAMQQKIRRYNYLVCSLWALLIIIPGHYQTLEYCSARIEPEVLINPGKFAKYRIYFQLWAGCMLYLSAEDYLKGAGFLMGQELAVMRRISALFMQVFMAIHTGYALSSHQLYTIIMPLFSGMFYWTPLVLLHTEHVSVPITHRRVRTLSKKMPIWKFACRGRVPQMANIILELIETAIVSPTTLNPPIITPAHKIYRFIFGEKLIAAIQPLRDEFYNLIRYRSIDLKSLLLYHPRAAIKYKFFYMGPMQIISMLFCKYNELLAQNASEEAQKLIRSNLTIDKGIPATYSCIYQYLSKTMGTYQWHSTIKLIVIHCILELNLSNINYPHGLVFLGHRPTNILFLIDQINQTLQRVSKMKQYRDLPAPVIKLLRSAYS